MRTVFGLQKELNKLGLLKNKHIPEKYFLGSKKQRLDLLRGLMDTDGSYNKIRHRFVMNTSNEWQAKDLSTLLSTLGVKSTVFRVTNSIGNKKFPG